MRLVIRISDDWRAAWQGYFERRELNRQHSLFAIRRWFCQQPVIAPPSPLRLVRGGLGLTKYSSTIGRRGVNGHGDDAA